MNKKIGGIDPRAQAVIKGLQPHHDSDYRLNKLWALHELDRVGKLRLLPVVAAVSAKNALGVPVANVNFTHSEAVLLAPSLL